MSSFDFAPLLAPGLPPPAAKWNGFPKYNFVGGHNDPDHVPVDKLIAAVTAVLAARRRDACDLWPGKRPAGLPAAARVSCRKAQAHRGHCLHGRRDPDHLGIAAGARSGQRRSAVARRHDHHRSRNLSGRAQSLDAARRQCRRHSARRRRHAHGRARGRARRSQAPRRARQIHLYRPDRAKSDRHDLDRSAPRRNAAARRAARRADLRGRLLFRSDLGRPAAAGALRHEQARRRHPYRLVLKIDRAGVARRLHRRRRGPILSRMLALKTDAGSGALEQMVLGEFCPAHFDAHVPRTQRAACARSSKR